MPQKRVPAPTAAPAAVDAPRKRRARGEPRRLLIASAQSVFNRKGYTSASTREIADHADVSETLMFRYFGSKAGLFREAMVVPFVELVDREIERRLANPRRFDEPREESRAFIADMYDVFQQHRALSASLFAADVLTDSELAESGVFDEVKTQIERLVSFGIEEARLQGAAVPPEVHELSTRALLAMVAGMSTFGTWYYGKRRPSRDAVIDEITNWALGRYLPGAALPEGATAPKAKGRKPTRKTPPPR